MHVRDWTAVAQLDRTAPTLYAAYRKGAVLQDQDGA